MSLRNLKTRIIILSFLAALFPVLLVVYSMTAVVERQFKEHATEEIKAAGQILAGSFPSRLDPLKPSWTFSSRQEGINYWSRALAPYIQGTSRGFPDLNLAIYSRDLDAFVIYTGRPDLAGKGLPPNHPGREVMETGKSKITDENLLAGNAMAALYPIYDGERVWGFLAAVESKEILGNSLWQIRYSALGPILLGVVLALSGALFLGHHLSRGVDILLLGIKNLGRGGKEPVPELSGELGEIGRALNELAISLEESRQLTELLVENDSAGVIVVDISGTITHFNSAAAKILSVPREEQIGKNLDDFMAAYFPGETCPLGETLREGSPLEGEKSYVIGGKSRLFSFRTNLLKTADGKVLGAFLILQDVTQERELAEHYRQAEKYAVVGQLAAGLAHEIRNPLTAARGFVQLLQKYVPPEGEEYTGIIIDSLDRVEAIVNQLLLLTRPSFPRKEEVSLADLLQEAISLLEGEAHLREIELAVELPPKEILVEVDREQIRHVFLSVAQNALEAMDKGGRLFIKPRYNPRKRICEILFQDTGPGIPREVLKKIFDPFFSTKETGTGLGLTVAYRIIQTHGGEIKIKSRKGQGTEVLITLPAQKK